MANKWIEFVKDWASKNNMSYGCAVSKQECKDAYRKANPKKLTKKELKQIKATPMELEEASPTEAKKAIDITINRKPKKPRAKKQKKEEPKQRKSSTAQRVFDIPELRKEILSFAMEKTPKITQSQLDDIVENIPDIFSYKLKMVKLIVIHADIAEKINEQNEGKVIGEARGKARLVAAFIGYMFDLLRERAIFLARENKLELDEDEFLYDYDFKPHQLDRAGIRNRKPYIYVNEAMDYMSKLLSPITKKYIELMGKMGVNEKQAVDVFEKRVNKESDEAEAKSIIKAFTKVYNKLKKQSKGKGIIQDIEKGAKKIGNKIKEYGEAVIYGRDDYPPKVRDIIKKYGDIPITKMYACRTPVNSLLTSALNAVSFGEFNKRFDKLPYDQLFHLDLRVELNTKPQTTILIEKNEVISATVNPKPPSKETECEFIPNNKSVTLNQLLEGGKKVLGGKFFSYSASSNNCQDFIMALLRGSGIGTQGNYDFIKQNTKALFKGLPGLRKTANTVTDLGAAFNTIIEGAGMGEEEEPTQGREIKGMGAGASSQQTRRAEDLNVMELNNYLSQLIALRTRAINEVEIGRLAISRLNREPTDLERLNYVQQNEGRLERINEEINLVVHLINLSQTTPPVTETEEIEGEGLKSEKPYYLQSVVFDKDKFSAKEAKEWLKKHNHKIKKTDETETQLRFRQVAPSYIKKKGYTSFITKKLGDSGVSLIISYK